MFNLLQKKSIIFSAFLLLLMFNVNAQQGDVQVNQSQEVDALLAIKKDLNKRKSNFKIQIYNGNRSGAENARSNFLSTYGWSTSMEYETPNYKIWVGNFRTRLDADRALIRVKRKFPNAFIFKLNKKN